MPILIIVLLEIALIQEIVLTVQLLAHRTVVLSTAVQAIPLVVIAIATQIVVFHALNRHQVLARIREAMAHSITQVVAVLLPIHQVVADVVIVLHRPIAAHLVEEAQAVAHTAAVAAEVEEAAAAQVVVVAEVTKKMFFVV